MSTPLRPLGDRVIIKPEAAPTQTTSGLHLPEHWKPEQTGTVLSVGNLVTLVRPDDYVIFSWQVGQEVFLNDHEERLIVLQERDLLAVVES